MNRLKIKNPNDGLLIVNSASDVLIRNINLQEEEIKSNLSMILKTADWLVVVMNIDSLIEQLSEEAKIILSIASENLTIQEGIKKHGLKNIEIKGTFALHHYLDEDIRINLVIDEEVQLAQYTVMYKNIRFGGSRVTADKEEIDNLISFIMKYWERLVEIIRKDKWV